MATSTDDLDIRVSLKDTASAPLKAIQKQFDATSEAADELADETTALQKSLDGLQSVVFMVKAALAGLGIAFTVSAMKSFVMEVTRMAGKAEELALVMEVAGKNANYSAKEMLEFEKALKQTGISTIEARQTLARLATSNIDLAESSRLARAAQDLAVVGGRNSSEAFESLVYAIQSASTEMLRTLGINVDFQTSYQKTAQELKKNVASLSEQEKLQSRVNVVLDEAAKYQGIYERAMTSAEKQLRSMTRYVDDFKVAFGAAFQPAYLAIVNALTKFFKEMQVVVSDPSFQEALKQISITFADIFSGGLAGVVEGVKSAMTGLNQWLIEFRIILVDIEAEMRRLAMLLDKMGGTLTSGAMLLFGPGAALGNENSKRQFEKYAQMNMDYQSRYEASEKRLIELADQRVKLEGDLARAKAGPTAAEEAKARRVKKEYEQESALRTQANFLVYQREQIRNTKTQAQIDQERTKEIEKQLTASKNYSDIRKAENEADLANLEQLYKAGLSVEEYYQRKIDLTREATAIEIAGLNKTIALEKEKAAMKTIKPEEAESALKRAEAAQAQITVLNSKLATNINEIRAAGLQAAADIAAEVAQLKADVITGEDEASRKQKEFYLQIVYEAQTRKQALKIYQQAYDEFNKDVIRAEEERDKYIAYRNDKFRKEQLDRDAEALQKKIDVERMMLDIAKRAQFESPTIYSDVFRQQQLELQMKQNEEIERLRKLNATKEQIEEAYRLQALERDKQLADQRMQIQQIMINNIKESLTFMSDALTSVYEMSGKKSKAAFYAAKAVAVAQTAISMYESAQKAYTAMIGIPYVGPVLAPIAAAAALAAGAMKIASIRNQNLAEGGEVKGKSPSPTADNIPVNATAGEYFHPVKTVQYYGKGVMEAIRRRLIPRDILAGYSSLQSRIASTHFAYGGLVKAADKEENKEGQGVVVVNYYDPNELARFLVSARGQDAIINVVNSRKETIRRTLS
jgi:hypothetical protein